MSGVRRVKTIRSDFTYEVRGDFVIVIDRNGRVSVSNDAEAVIGYIYSDVFDLASKRVIYRDGEGRWDGMVTREGRFVDFHLLGKDTADEAMAAWKGGEP